MGLIVNHTNSMVKSITFYNADGTAAGTMSITKSSQKKTKKLQYNFKQVSSRILSAKTSQSARSALVMAKSKTAELRRKLRSGEYDSTEIQSALIHAEKMERVAKKRQRHLKEEEMAEKTGVDALMDEWEEKLMDELESNSGQVEELSREKLQELMQQMQEMMEHLQEEMQETIKQADGMDEWTEETTLNLEDLEPQDLENLKKKHRAEEQRDIMEADMKYLKAMFDRLQEERNGASSTSTNAYSNLSGATLELSGVDTEIAAAETSAALEASAVEGSTVDVSV